MYVFTKPTTGMRIFATAGRGDKCRGGCGRTIDSQRKAFFVIPSFNAHYQRGIVLDLKDRALDSRECVVGHLAKQKGSGFVAIAAWANDALPETP
jgi:hypothetical protein